MRIIWAPEAIGDLAALRSFIEEDDASAARRIALHIVRTIEEFLPEHPHMGRVGRVPGTRELVISRIPYVVPYRVRHNVIEILRVYHDARRWPDRFS